MIIISSETILVNANGGYKDSLLGKVFIECYMSITDKIYDLLWIKGKTRKAEVSDFTYTVSGINMTNIVIILYAFNQTES